MAMILLGCGLRRAEAAEARFENYQPDDASRVIVGKGNKERRVYLPEPAKAALDVWIDHWRGTEPGALFCRIRRESMVMPEHHITPVAVGLILKNYMDQVYTLTDLNAGQGAPRGKLPRQPHFSTHDLRRTFATRLLDDGVDLVTVQGMMGHANVSTTAKYDRRGEEARRRASKKVRI